VIIWAGLPVIRLGQPLPTKKKNKSEAWLGGPIFFEPRMCFLKRFLIPIFFILLICFDILLNKLLFCIENFKTIYGSY
jgi:hypothetical protein